MRARYRLTSCSSHRVTPALPTLLPFSRQSMRILGRIPTSNGWHLSTLSDCQSAWYVVATKSPYCDIELLLIPSDYSRPALGYLRPPLLPHSWRFHRHARHARQWPCCQCQHAHHGLDDQIGRGVHTAFLLLYPRRAHTYQVSVPHDWCNQRMELAWTRLRPCRCSEPRWNPRWLACRLLPLNRSQCSLVHLLLLLLSSSKFYSASWSTREQKGVAETLRLRWNHLVRCWSFHVLARTLMGRREVCMDFCRSAVFHLDRIQLSRFVRLLGVVYAAKRTSGASHALPSSTVGYLRHSYRYWCWSVLRWSRYVAQNFNYTQRSANEFSYNSHLASIDSKLLRQRKPHEGGLSIVNAELGHFDWWRRWRDIRQTDRLSEVADSRSYGDRWCSPCL
jgi:hypothetical protein